MPGPGEVDMTRGIKLLRILGIQISIDYTWFIVFAVFAWSLAYGYFPYYHPGLEKQVYLVMGIVSALLLFTCVLIHEMSHSVTANRLGMDIRGITLFIFGGVAELTKEPEDPIVELKIAVAGPIASGLLSGIFWLLAKTVSGGEFPVAAAILSYLALINLVLLIFNLIPGFPLDGGRVLRALWWAKSGDFDSATRVASNAGKGFAVFLIMTGFFQVFIGNFTGGLWSVLIGFFLMSAAESGYRQLLIKRALGGVRVGDVMSRSVVTVDASLTIASAVDRLFLVHHFISYPVISGGRVAGILTLNNVRGIERERWESTLVGEAMTELSPADILSPAETAIEALGKISANNIGRAPVVEDGRVVGMVSRGDIMRLLEFKSALGR